MISRVKQPMHTPARTSRLMTPGVRNGTNGQKMAIKNVALVREHVALWLDGEYVR
jgi:hypothetical protein